MIAKEMVRKAWHRQMSVRVVLAVSVAKEMMREACRRGEKVIIPLPPPHLSIAQIHSAVSLPSRFAWKAEERLIVSVPPGALMAQAVAVVLDSSGEVR